ncbi:MAG: hypothetical protein AUG84_02815 [Chloroflexi bacterium 13_1_20CM_4_66_7]|nr:MAG: hypothetical protein AUG84_02815 [Chloroflexi bacterium 13_1_20CM_4_66_7]
MFVSQPSAEAIALGLNTADPATLVIDLNCAFASIEQQHDPELRGRVLAIAAYATDAATIVSSSREARDLGIKTGMRVFEAKAIFPGVIVREPNPPLYRETSDKLMEILERHSPDVLRMSIDEASLNLAGTPDLKKLGPEGVGLAIKKAIQEEVGECVTASVGISTSIWMAKQASNLDKRDGLQRIDHTNLVSVFERLQLTELSGIADATARRLARGGIHTPVQLLRATAPRLRLAGMHAEVARGWSMRLRGFEVGGFESVRRKSYSPGHISRQAKQPEPVATGDEIYQAALKLLASRDPRLTVGTLGVGVSALSDEDSGQLDLFREPAPPRGQRLEAAVDAIRDRFGEDAVQRSRLLGRARVVRDRIAFGNTGHPDESRRNRS